MKTLSPSQPYVFINNKVKTTNRIVLAAMTNKQSYQNGIISESEISWLSHRAKGGFGIITTAATNVSIEGKAWEGQFGVYDDSHNPNLNKLTTAIHQSNSLIFAQLFHGGMRSSQKLTGLVPISASKLKCNESNTGKCQEASKDDIKKIISDFTESAIRCSDAGFDGIELHGAHGYLISQFLGKKTNLRIDSWGGDIAGRSKLLIEIYNSIKNNVPESFIVGVRISPILDDFGIDLNDTINLVGTLKKIGIDFIHLSCWDAFKVTKENNQDNRTLTEYITSSYSNLPAIITTGAVWSSLDANKLLKQGADLIGVARVAIAYPNWAKNISNLNYNPKKPPFTIQHLEKAKLSKIFINYMKNWKDFVLNENE